VTALVGRNGVGKSTLARLIAGADVPTSGRVELVSATGAALPLRAARSSVGWLPQEFGYPARLRVRDFLGYAGWLKGVKNNQVPTALQRVDGLFNLSLLLSRRMGELSGGQLRRVGLAAANFHSPTYLILDEPTNALDAEHKDALLEYLESDAIKPPVVVLITHVESDVSRLASHVVTLTAPESQSA